MNNSSLFRLTNPINGTIVLVRLSQQFGQVKTEYLHIPQTNPYTMNATLPARQEQSRHPSRLLSRMDPRLLDELNDSDEAQVAYAEEHMGYKHPSEIKKVQSSKFLRELLIAGIRPFDPATVESYKKERIRKNRLMLNIAAGIAKVFEKQKGTRSDGTPVMDVTIFCVLFGLSMCAISAVGLVWTIIALIGSYSVTTPLVILGVGLSMVLFFFGTSYVVEKIGETWSWRKIPLKGYKAPIPAFALATAREIHMRLPQATFSIDEMFLEKKVYDPFLVVHDTQGNSYHVEVWDEPSFKQDRRI